MFFKDFWEVFYMELTFFLGLFFNLLWSPRTKSSVIKETEAECGIKFTDTDVEFSYFLSPYYIFFHQTIFLITQQKLQHADFKQHETTARETNITAGGERSLWKHEEIWAYRGKPPKLALCLGANVSLKYIFYQTHIPRHVKVNVC